MKAILRAARSINTRVTYANERNRSETLVVKIGASVSHKTQRVNVHDMERNTMRKGGRV